MNHKESMLAAIRGELLPMIPYAPRMDLWYNSRRRLGTLPKKYKDATLEQILDDNDLAHHIVIPHLKELRSESDDIDRGLGFYNISTMPYQTILENVGRKVSIEGDATIVNYETPFGTVTTKVVYDDAMKDSGASITHIARHAFQSPSDYKTLAYIFRNARVEKTYQQYTSYAENIGGRGLCVVYVNFVASPVQYIMRDLMKYETFVFEMNDHPDEFQELTDGIADYFNRLLDACLDCPGEVFFLGSNYDSSIHYPRFFRKHLLPTLKDFSKKLHDRGKFLLTHTDGENKGLLDLYIDAGIDVADSVCPKPMTSLTYREHHVAFKDRITILGGIPSIALLNEVFSDAQFDSFLDGFFDELGDGRRAILGISDTTPPGADLERILHIKRRILKLK
ncbi:MAG: uroporphyrinogen decarboxylase family protein [Planctomycetota bacterium]